MRYVFFILIFGQLLNLLDVLAEKVKNEQRGLNSINWEKVDENKSNPLKKIIWKSYKEDENYFKNKNKKGFSTTQSSEGKSAWMEPTTWRNRTLRFSYEEIDMPDAG